MRLILSSCFFTGPKSQDKKLNILRTKKAFEVKWKAFFIIFKGLSIAKYCFRLECAPLSMYDLLMDAKGLAIVSQFVFAPTFTQVFYYLFCVLFLTPSFILTFLPFFRIAESINIINVQGRTYSLMKKLKQHSLSYVPLTLTIANQIPHIWVIRISQVAKSNSQYCPEVVMSNICVLRRSDTVTI